jgi:hypothetical protein
LSFSPFLFSMRLLERVEMISHIKRVPMSHTPSSPPCRYLSLDWRISPSLWGKIFSFYPLVIIFNHLISLA